MVLVESLGGEFSICPNEIWTRMETSNGKKKVFTWDLRCEDADYKQERNDFRGNFFSHF